MLFDQQNQGLFTPAFWVMVKNKVKTLKTKSKLPQKNFEKSSTLLTR
jgi:hypothetical protein